VDEETKQVKIIGQLSSWGCLFVLKEGGVW